MKLAVIVAVAENGVLGRDNRLPWHLPEDLKHFKRVTLGKPIVMGRKTWESIGRPLPGRHNIVISRQPGYIAAGATTVATLTAAGELAASIARADGIAEWLVIGGAQLYAEALPQADTLYFTEVHARVAGDVQLPPVDWARWREISRIYHPAMAPDAFAYSFVTYERR